MSYTGSVPETPRPADWRDAAACRAEDPELFFPKGYEGPWQLIIEQAKTVCRQCPVLEQCLQYALDNHVGDGIFGGLTERERRSLSRALRRGRTAPEDTAAKADEARNPKRERTLHTIFGDNTTRLYNGHLAWTGSTKVGINGRVYSPRQIAFIVDRGRAPEGPVLSDCGVADCVLPSHVRDQDERSVCGSRPGYRRHLANGETPCGSCKRANADGDNRLRWTGTTKALAS